MNIDRIAREMVDVEPSVNLEARIRARLDAASPEPRAAWWTWRVAVPVGAVAALALAIVVQSPAFRVQSPHSTAAMPEAGASPLAEVRSSPVPQFPNSQVARVGTAQLPKIPTSQLSKAASKLSAEEMAWMERRLPALDPVNALQMDRLRVDSIQPEPLAITPLTMTPVATESGGIERRHDR